MTDFAITIGGQPVTTFETFDVIDPANGELAGKCPCGSADDVNEGWY